MASMQEVETASQAQVDGCREVVDATGQVASALEDVLREGARQMLLAAIEAEVDEYVEGHQQECATVAPKAAAAARPR